MQKRYVVFGLATVLALSLAVPALGGPSNPIADGASAAKSTASKALKKARKANKKATAAQQAADAAQADANAARQAANGAQTTADQANTNAEAAQTAAANAQTTADGAAAAAAAAQATADSKFGEITFRAGDPSAVNSTDKTVVAVCNADERLASGGWTTTGAGNNDITPSQNSAYLNAWVVGMQEIGAGTAETWGVTATVHCLDQ